MIKEFFYFQKSDRRVMIFLMVVIVLSVAIIALTGGGDDVSQVAPNDSVAPQPATVYKQEKHERQYIYNVETKPRELFVFDPNTADSTQLLRLGLQPWQVKNIYRYRAKGGVYRRPEDFARLYGLTVKQYRELQPYIRISDDYRPAAELYAAQRDDDYQRDTLLYPVKLSEGQFVVLDNADTTQLKKVPGIGRYFAARIVRYREELGGYADVSQLTEIEDFPEETLPYFRTNGTITRKLNLNKLTLNQLKRHPYINFYQARHILDYRRLKGPLHSLDDLQLLKDFTPADIERLRPYVEF